MEDYKKLLLSKNGIATLNLAKEFLQFKIGDRIPTVTQLSKKLGLSHGTTQNALRFLQQNNAIKLLSKGHLGTFLTRKSPKILLEFAGITSIVGAMPLPYSKRYEGFATGLLQSMKKFSNLPVSMAYMRGAINRLNLLLANRCDYIIVSKYTAEEFIKENNNLLIVKKFGPNSYLSSHIIIFHNENDSKIIDGMKVGIDLESIDQLNLTKYVCQDKKVQFVEVEYSQMLSHVLNGLIDAAVWNKDEITDKIIDVNQTEITLEDFEVTEAVIIVDKDRSEIIALLNEIVYEQEVLRIQNDVLNGIITPSY